MFQSSYKEQRLQRLQERLQVPFDETRPDHQVCSLWCAKSVSFNNLVPLLSFVFIDYDKVKLPLYMMTLLSVICKGLWVLCSKSSN